MILRIQSLKQSLRPSAFRYQTVRDFLYYGPPIYMHYSEFQGDRWRGYQSAVDELLRDPGSSDWLDGYMEPEWTESVEKHGWRGRDQRKIYHTLSIFFWISHITSALGFLLIANTSEPIDAHGTGDSSSPMSAPSSI